MKALLLLLPLALCACPPTPAPPTPPDASDASPAPPVPAKIDAMAGDLGTQVCEHLAAIGCPQPPTCATTLNKDQGRVTDFRPACLLDATSVFEANLCHSIHCP